MTDLWTNLRRQASQQPQRIVLTDGIDERALAAARILRQERIAEPLLMGDRRHIPAEFPSMDPAGLSEAEREHLEEVLVGLLKSKGVTPEEARHRLEDPLVLGCLLLREGKVDGLVGGATRTTADTLRAVFSIIGLATGVSTLFGFFILESKGLETPRYVLLADCAVIPDPSARQLAHTGLGAAAACRRFLGTEPRVAYLAFSTRGSAEHESLEKIRKAVAMVKAKSPNLAVDGELQADAALVPEVAERKGAADSPVAGHANVLIVPDLHSGNIAYKLVERLGGCRAVGPILWGTARPANDLSRGCSSEDIVDAVAMTALQSQDRKREVSHVA